ncbi:MAG: NAD+ synthase [Proteobacteria bacterium]|nr:NAD+ synthase [Pseudomonadota bacterium]
MSDTLNIALAQINSTLGDIDGNSRKMAEAAAQAQAQNADLVVMPELCISGYPPEDLVCRPAYIEGCMEAAQALAEKTAKGPALLIGLPWKSGEGYGAKPYNAAALLRAGKIEKLWFKYDLPNYGIFDDKRVFMGSPKEEGEIFALKGIRLGVAVCEDLWSKDKAMVLRRNGAEVILSLNASPLETDKQLIRKAQIAARVKETGLPVVYVNAVGGQDEVLFDGGSFVMNQEGQVAAALGLFEEKLVLTRWQKNGKQAVPEALALADVPSEEETLYGALVLGLRDYVEKNGFPGVLLGLSGGIDSALVACLAVDAFGPKRVTTVMMPSPYTSKESLDDAAAVVKALDCDYRTVSIEPGMRALGTALAPQVQGRNTDLMDQNIQSRLRGVILMALSNATGFMVMATGNKSEYATGYTTLYGDMCGGYAPIKDVYKTLVYRLSRWRNAHRPQNGLGPAGKVIPENILTRAPTAELKVNQKDQDTLPPYDVLDDILQCLVEKEMGVADIVSRGHPEAVVQKVLRMLKTAEYKRHQAPPGTKITARAFGRDRRYPMTNKFGK